jgi:protein-tyrosine phosphatase
MGINRGPSLAFAVMLAQGWNPVEALTSIRAARPIAAIAYARDALSWWQCQNGIAATVAARQQAAVSAWFDTNPLDVVRIIRQVRVTEQLGA